MIGDRAAWAHDEQVSEEPDSTEQPPTYPTTPSTGSQTAYDGNRQQVEHGLAVLGSARDITSVRDIFVTYAMLDDGGDGKVVKPRFREGPYPAEEVVDRLRGFVEPPSYPGCLKVLIARRVLLLRGEAGTGTSTAALGLLREVTQDGRITGLAADDLTEWSPSAAGGYLVQGITPEAGGLLDEVALNQLNGQLRDARACLVVIVDRTVELPRTLMPWCRDHLPPEPRDVAQARLVRMADEGALSSEQLTSAQDRLDEPPFKEYLGAARSPAAGVEVAEELREVVAHGRSREAAADNLRLGSAEAAEQLLAAACDNVDDLALITSIALLEGQDRSVVERFAALLRPLFTARLEPTPHHAGRDLLGRAIGERLTTVQARLLPRTIAVTRGHRYWTQPVVFRGKHLAEEVLRRLWLDYEGLSDILQTWMRALPYEPGVDRITGRRIGKVLCQASGPDVLRQLNVFAHSPLAWQRRLAGYALGEVVQDAVLSTAVRAQLRQWSRLQTSPEARCTVAETCAGSLGLALPAFSLGLLNSVLAGDEGQLNDDVRKAVSAALGVLLTEETNVKPILMQLTAWLTASAGTARHRYAVRAVQALCGYGLPDVNRSGIRRITLADVFTSAREPLIPLVLAALDDEALSRVMSTALATLERSLEPDGHERMDAFLGALAEASGGHRGLRRYLLARYLERFSATPREELR